MLLGILQMDGRRLPIIEQDNIIRADHTNIDYLSPHRVLVEEDSMNDL